MTLKTDCTVEESLVIKLSFDDNSQKVKVLDVGDYVIIRYNRDGVAKVVSGTVVLIHCNPYSNVGNRSDWYILVQSDDDSHVGTVKINPMRILDVEIAHKKNQPNPINTTNNRMRVTDIRLNNGVLQISQNDGRTWMNVRCVLDCEPVGEELNVQEKLDALIGSDMYADSIEFRKGVCDIIYDEARKIASQSVSNMELDDTVV